MIAAAVQPLQAAARSEPLPGTALQWSPARAVPAAPSPAQPELPTQLSGARALTPGEREVAVVFGGQFAAPPRVVTATVRRPAGAPALAVVGWHSPSATGCTVTLSAATPSGQGDYFLTWTATA